jgi:hypothetical protein
VFLVAGGAVLALITRAAAPAALIRRFSSSRSYRGALKILPARLPGEPAADRLPLNRDGGRFHCGRRHRRALPDSGDSQVPRRVPIVLGWHNVLVVAWAGMRGESMVIALTLPSGRRG